MEDKLNLFGAKNWNIHEPLNIIVNSCYSKHALLFFIIRIIVIIRVICDYKKNVL